MGLMVSRHGTDDWNKEPKKKLALVKKKSKVSNSFIPQGMGGGQSDRM